MGRTKGIDPVWGGKYGDFSTYTRRTGVLVVRQRHNKVGKPTRTEDNMQVKMRWANVVNAWKYLGPKLNYSFEIEKPGVTCYNRFTSINFKRSSVYLTKEQSRLGACVVENFVVSAGSLDEEKITLTKVEDKYITSIRVRNLNIDKDTTIGEFTSKVLSSNPDIYKEGDAIIFLRVTQTYDDSMDMPRLKVWSRMVTLEMGNNAKLWDEVGSDGFLSTQSTIDSISGMRLCAEIQENSLIAYIHTRQVDKDQVLCSPQVLVGENSLIEEFADEEAFNMAVESYGGINRVNNMKPSTKTTSYIQTYGDDDLFDENDNLIGSNSGSNTGSGTGNTDPTNPSTPSNPGTTPSNPGTNPSNPTPSGNIEISVAISPSADMGHVEGAGSYAEGEQVTLRAIPNAGYRFVWWQDNHDQNAQRVITVGNENASYTAVFGEII